jgi:hypothetical protein
LAAAFISSCLFVWVFFGARLYVDSVLNAFYAGTAVLVLIVIGMREWRRSLPLAPHAA